MLFCYSYRFAGARVAPDPGIAALDRKGAETAQLDPVATGQCRGDFVEYGLHDALHIPVVEMWVLFGKVQN